VNKHSNKPHPKAGQIVDHRTDLLNQKHHSKPNCPTSLGEELTKYLQMKDNTDVSWGNEEL
jgi:hypothetical protein